jgi:hypothetical protein
LSAPGVKYDLSQLLHLNWWSSVSKASALPVRVKVSFLSSKLDEKFDMDDDGDEEEVLSRLLNVLQLVKLIELEFDVDDWHFAINDDDDLEVDSNEELEEVDGEACLGFLLAFAWDNTAEEADGQWSVCEWVTIWLLIDEKNDELLLAFDKE